MKKYDFATTLGMELRLENHQISCHMKIQLSERVLTENGEKLDFQAEMKCKTCFPANCCLLYEITLFERALTQNGKGDEYT